VPGVSALLANSTDDTVVGVGGLFFAGVGIIVVVFRGSIARLLKRFHTALGSDLAAQMSTPGFVLVWGIAAIVLGAAAAFAWISTVT
jgi:hypothetical protein